jgi:hypothetical protein
MKDIEGAPFLKAEEVCKILEACALYGASVIRFHGLEVEFVQLQELLPIVSGPAPTMPEEVREETIRRQKQAEIASHEEQELQVREDQIAELLLSDPLRAEELMMQGELVSTGEDNGGDQE